MKYELIFSNGEEIFEKAEVEEMNESLFSELVDTFFAKIFKDEELFCPEDKELYYQQVKDNCFWRVKWEE